MGTSKVTPITIFQRGLSIDVSKAQGIPRNKWWDVRKSLPTQKL